MPEEIYTIAAVVTALASIVAVWSAWRRRVLMRRLVRSLDAKQRQALGLDPPADPSQTTDNRQPTTTK